MIGGVALATAAAVSVFFVEPSEGAPDEQPVIAAEAPVETASLDPTFLPVRKVVMQHIKVKTDRPEPVKTSQPAEEQATTQAAADIDALTPLDPRWARATVPSPEWRPASPPRSGNAGEARGQTRPDGRHRDRSDRTG